METKIKAQDFNPLHTELKDYGIDEVITSKWDELQSDFHCCGASDIGYKVKCAEFSRGVVMLLKLEGPRLKNFF